MSQDISKLFSDYPISEHHREVRTGDPVRLKADVVVKDHCVQSAWLHPRGEIWTLLLDAAEEPVVVWLLQANGQARTWNDGPELLAAFNVVPPSSD